MTDGLGISALLLKDLAIWFITDVKPGVYEEGERPEQRLAVVY